MHRVPRRQPRGHATGLRRGASCAKIDPMTTAPRERAMTNDGDTDIGLRASCWQRETMCADAKPEGVKLVAVAELRALDREPGTYWGEWPPHEDEDE